MSSHKNQCSYEFLPVYVVTRNHRVEKVFIDRNKAIKYCRRTNAFPCYITEVNLTI